MDAHSEEPHAKDAEGAKERNPEGHTEKTGTDLGGREEQRNGNKTEAKR
jgi:hypothetical protein